MMAHGEFSPQHQRVYSVNMKVPTRLSLRLLPQALKGSTHARLIHSSAAQAANVVPVVGTGPPPEPPTPATRPFNDRIERRKRQAELLKATKVIRNAKDGKSTTLSGRFWKDVSVKEVNGALEVHLDTRPLRHPQTKEIVRLPTSKPNLATALALEWDTLTSARQSTKQHLIPLTSLVCRALDIADDDASGAAKIRRDVTASVLRYLDTDSLLCWAPPAGPHDLRNDAGECLRDVQKRAAAETVSFLTTHQPEGVREIVQGWVEGLDAWEIVGLERAVLAGKSLIAAARLVAEWSEGPSGKRNVSRKNRFGIQEAARAASLEVDWQITQWGEVEDTHDVQKEDLRRQLGSVVLLVSGTGQAA
ncbi:ATP12 chaperone protein [Hirsutella rhossiliensis]|uniref:ATP12 chaperone protein n=1 Tax=Hirsutella rhossiliensis TaxID=111463 RepID=A0A9P8N0A3_9HYPO|nr:ATP12 chaperone protein [Hirsutella rhossiliensis]KAH0964252.1 ATP12 chaperone protein [Hirsutella rhossiliensis]